jgi:hypothetical protein
MNLCRAVDFSIWQRGLLCGAPTPGNFTMATFDQMDT